MKRLLVSPWVLALPLVFAAGGAMAQAYKWVDQNGRTQYGDFPPAGVKATPLRGTSSAPAAPAAAPKAPSLAEREAAFRQRQKDSQKAADKAAAAESESAAKKENCARAQEYLRSLESGVRIAFTDKSGERAFLDDQQRASETAKARQMVKQSCE